MVIQDVKLKKVYSLERVQTENHIHIETTCILYSGKWWYSAQFIEVTSLNLARDQTARGKSYAGCWSSVAWLASEYRRAIHSVLWLDLAYWP